MATPSNFIDLQAGFYNALSQGLGYSPSDPFQIIQPSPPISSGQTANQELFDYLNAIPPASLTHNMSFSGGNQFLSDYQGVMSALKAAPNTFRATIGDTCFSAYQDALKRGDVQAGGNAPKNFRDWALVQGACSTVAVSGASALAAAMLDPVFAAQLNVMNYRPAGSKPVDFTPNYERLVSLLNNAPSRSFTVQANSWNTDISRAWANEQYSAFFGLWKGSSSSSSLSQKFASSGVVLTANFSNVLPFYPTPGEWYSSSALGLAFHTPQGAPWDPEKPINWDKTFGHDGNMQRFVGQLVIAGGMDIWVSSSASYTEIEQQQIQESSSWGIWPIYSGSSSGGSSTSVSFNASGNMAIRITSKANVPVIIGCTVLPADQYLGHEITVAHRIHSMLYA
jgi:hypothetical protein